MGADLREEGERIGGLLAELQSSCGPQTWGRVEELLHRLLHVYGSALERVLDHARGAGGPALEERLFADDLLESLFRLHRLHPQSLEERIRLALERAGPLLASRIRDPRLIDASGGVARIAVSFLAGAEGRARQGLEEAIRRIVLEAAPELEEIRIHDPDEAPASPGLVRLRVPAEGRR